ncbi:MAG: DUF1501 domain-containing protein [Bacteroidia bacterium]|nr:DUF1501 domain-containing protein [Bacteroidia bacterium]
MKRRDFVKQTSLASGLFFVPSFIQAFDGIVGAAKGYRRLVIIQLSGGNDGLNTIIPYRNDIYYRNRPKIAIQRNTQLRIDGELAMHQTLTPLKRLYDNGYVCILNNVGYPNPDRSHFRSMDIWQTASHSHEYLSSGWLGRYLDRHGDEPYNGIEISDKLSLALTGDKSSGIATNNAGRLYRTAQDPYLKLLIKHHRDEHLSEHNLGYLYKTLIQAESSAEYIYETTRKGRSYQRYTNDSFGKQLKTMAEFINSGIQTKVFYTSHEGYDTHAGQLKTQPRLLNVFSKNLEAFVNDLQKGGSFDDTLIMVFSEFGRRVRQNAANGTDHGAANNVFIVGKNLKKNGIYNGLDDLRRLDANGDIRYEIDFRSIYSTILRNWLGVQDDLILNDQFEYLDFI